MCGNSSMSFVLQVWRLQVNGQGIGAILLFVEVVNLNGAFFFGYRGRGIQPKVFCRRACLHRSTLGEYVSKMDKLSISNSEYSKNCLDREISSIYYFYIDLTSKNY